VLMCTAFCDAVDLVRFVVLLVLEQFCLAWWFVVVGQGRIQKF
jgi:hypothetical protein